MFAKKSLLALALAGIMIGGGIAAVNAESNPSSPLQSSMQAYVISLGQDGEETAQAAQEVEPGQVIEYRMDYKNVGQTSLKGIAVTGPVPSATHYLDNTAVTQAASDFMVSIDGGKTFEGEPVKRMVENEQGKKVEKIIPPSEYTHVRWILNQPLAAGETKSFSYRSLVD
jgi:uncharacterized repeat protein (TIGR01451 family)